MNAHPASFYVAAVRPSLPAEAFAPTPSRLGWLVLHLALAVGGIAVIAHGWGGWPLALAMSLVIGHSFAGTAFLGHEVMHGSVVKSRRQSHWIGWLCVLPFTLSPRLWKAWHNRIHHGNTMIAGVDPDAYPTLTEWRTDGGARAMEKFSVARGHWLGLLCFAVGFSIQALQMLVGAHRRKYLTRSQHLLAIGESLLGVAVWASLAVWLGPAKFVFAYVLPLLFANTLAMAYILTNHNLNPLNDVNDPLLNSLTVTVPEFWNAMHARFGLHVEHHLFPAMSSEHLPRVRTELMKRWPERYQSTTLVDALSRLMRTPRVYRTPTVLHDPSDGFEVETLLPREGMEQVA